MHLEDVLERRLNRCIYKHQVLISGLESTLLLWLDYDIPPSAPVLEHLVPN